MNSIAGPATMQKDDLAARLRPVAQQFEALLIGALLRSLEQTFGESGGSSPIAGARDYQYLGSEALSAVIAQRGGFGIADQILRNLLN